MRTKILPFQFEQTLPGAFLLQGLTGGMFVGFTCMFVLMHQIGPIPESFLIVIYTPFVMGIGATFGFFLAVPLWVIYRLTGIRMRAPVRVAVITIGLGLLVSFLIYRLGSTFDPRTLAISAGVSFLISLPTALLVGSRVRAWRFFTFWSIAVRHHEINKRLRASAIPAVGGVVPLRLLSVSVLAFWMLLSAGIWPASERDLKQGLIFGLIPITYLALSAYLTFRSPRKFVLLAIGLVINLPIIYLSYFGDGIFPETYLRDTSSLVTLIGTIFLAAWALFIATRFVVDSRDVFPTTDSIDLLKSNNEQEHHCLGSRFMEWRERQA